MTTSLTVPEVDRSPPPSEQIAEYYRDKMRRGELSVGDTMPTVRTVVEEWKVSTHTAQRAYRRLSEEGLIEIRRPRTALVIAVPTA